jgi:ADP-heptose:LPS heptosyltransferase
VKQHDQLGDFLLSTSVIGALRRSFPNAHLSICVRSYTKPVTENSPYLDEVIVFYEQLLQWNPIRIWHFWKSLRSKPFDLAVVLNTFSHSFTSDLIALASRAAIRLGPRTPLLNGRNPFYTHKPPLQGIHESDRYLSILAPLGISVTKDEVMRSEKVYVSGNEKEDVRSFFKRMKGPYIGIHPGGGKLENRWSSLNFARLGDLLKKKYGGEIIVLWGKQDGEAGKEVIEKMTEEAKPLYGLNLRSLSAILSHLHLFIGNDTGLLHLASAVKIPSIGIYGPTDPEKWKPPEKWVRTVRGEDRTCESVPIGAVECALEELIHENLVDTSQFNR